MLGDAIASNKKILAILNNKNEARERHILTKHLLRLLTQHASNLFDDIEKETSLQNINPPSLSATWPFFEVFHQQFVLPSLQQTLIIGIVLSKMAF